LDSTLIEVTPESGAYQTISTMLILMSSLYISSSVLINAKNQFKDDDVIGLEDIDRKWTIKIPCYAPLPAALNGRLADVIHIQKDTYEQYEQPHYNAGSLFNIAELILMPMFINYFESHNSAIKSQWGREASKWKSDAWKMGYVVRNSFAHNGLLDIRAESFSVDWNGQQIAKENHGEQLIGNYCSVGNILDLLLEMENDRARLSTPS
jgi:hypothetical protein